jgi:DNA-binding phage protein
MALTRDFKTTVKGRVQRDPKFRKALLREALESAIAGDVDTGKSVLRDYVNATIGFPQLSAAVGIPPKSLMRMLAPAGNPTASNFFAIVALLQRREGVRLRVKSVAA